MHGFGFVGLHAFCQHLLAGVGGSGVGLPQHTQAVHLFLCGGIGGHVVEHLTVHLTTLHLHSRRRQIGVTADAELTAAVDAEVAHSLFAVLPHEGIHAALPSSATFEGVTVAFPHSGVHQRYHIAMVTADVHHRVGAATQLEGKAILLARDVECQNDKRQYGQYASHRFYLFSLK